MKVLSVIWNKIGGHKMSPLVKELKTNDMKIFILSDPCSIHTKRWISALAERGISVFLFGLSTDNTNHYLKYDNVTIFSTNHISRLKNRIKNGSFEKLKYLTVIGSLKKCIKNFQPDILHAHYASSYGLLGALSGFHPYIVSAWGSDVYDFPGVSFLHKSILKYNLLKADQILSTSHIMAKEVNKYTDKIVEVTPFGVDINLFKKQDIIKEDDTFMVGNVKTLSHKYGIDVLIKAFKIVKESNPYKDIKLNIIGDGPDKDKLKKLAADLAIADSVYFRGKVENNLLPEWYNLFSVSVSASVLDSESFGVVAVEAMACECPVIVSDADGFTEVVVNNETGIIVPKKDIVATAAAIQKYIDNPNLREDYGKKGRKRVEQLYDWNKNVDKMIHIYINILKP